MTVAADATLTPELAAKRNRLLDVLAGMRSVAVAFITAPFQPWSPLPPLPPPNPRYAGVMKHAIPRALAPATM